MNYSDGTICVAGIVGTGLIAGNSVTTFVITGICALALLGVTAFVRINEKKYKIAKRTGSH